VGKSGAPVTKHKLLPFWMVPCRSAGSAVIASTLKRLALSPSELLASFTIFTANPEVNMMAACWLHSREAAANASMRAGISQLHQQVQMQGGIWLQR